MPPDRNLGSADIADRYGVSHQRARQLLYAMRADGVGVDVISRRLVVRESEVRAWEADRAKIGRPLPGARRRGPKRRNRFAGDAMTGPHDRPQL